MIFNVWLRLDKGEKKTIAREDMKKCLEQSGQVCR